MTNEEIAVELARQEQHLKSQAHRIDELEEYQKETRDLVRSVDKLAQSMQTMATEQERQGKQIDALELSKSDTFKYWLRTILTAVATGLIGYALAMFMK
jgi:chromosome segregation ATPase